VSLTRDVDVALAAAEVGAAVVRQRFGSALLRVEKGGGDFATSADVEAERAMVALVCRERPGDAILGEETGQTGPGTADASGSSIHFAAPTTTPLACVWSR